MRLAAVALLALSTLWFVALVVAALDALPALLDGQGRGTEAPGVVVAYGVSALVLGACSVLLLGLLVRSRRGPPRWARPLAFACAAGLGIAAVAGWGRPELILMGFPALAFAVAGVALGGPRDVRP